MEFYARNECSCQSDTCKDALNQAFREFLKTHEKEGNIRDFISIITGTQKSTHSCKIFCFLLNHLEHYDGVLSKELFEAYLELFTVLFLKSEQVIKAVLIADLIDLLQALKDSGVSLFSDKKFGLKIVLYRIYQFKHCIKKKTDCAITSRKVSEIFSHQVAVECDVHRDFNVNESTLDLSHPERFCPMISFLLSLVFKIVNTNESGPDHKQFVLQQKSRVCYILFNFIHSCPNEYLFYPLRALYEIFHLD